MLTDDPNLVFERDPNGETIFKLLINLYREPIEDLFIKQFSTLGATPQQYFFHYSVVTGHYKNVETILKIDPAILLEKGFIQDYSGRTLYGTGFQMALGAGDVEMCRMMHKYFDQIKDGLSRARNQFDEQFPDGVNEPPLDDYDFENLMQLCFNASSDIDTSPNVDNSEEAKVAIAQFKTKYAIQPNEPICQGLHFNHTQLIRALYCYAFSASRFRAEEKVFFKQIIGYLESQLPACDAQIFCNGFRNVFDKSQSLDPSIRSFKIIEFFYDNEWLEFYPLKFNGLCQLGENIAFTHDPFDRDNPICAVGFGSYARDTAQAFERLVSQKKQELTTLRYALNFPHDASFSETARCCLL